MSLALQQVKKVNTLATKKEYDNYTCDWTSQFYIILALRITIKVLVIFAILHARKIKLCRG